MRFHIQPLPADPLLLLHLLLVAVLMIVFPFSKLLACTRALFQPDAQPGRQPARTAASRTLGQAARTGSGWQVGSGSAAGLAEARQDTIRTRSNHGKGKL